MPVRLALAVLVSLAMFGAPAHAGVEVQRVDLDADAPDSVVIDPGPVVFHDDIEAAAMDLGFRIVPSGDTITLPDRISPVSVTPPGCDHTPCGGCALTADGAGCAWYHVGPVEVELVADAQPGVIGATIEIQHQRPTPVVPFLVVDWTKTIHVRGEVTAETRLSAADCAVIDALAAALDSSRSELIAGGANLLVAVLAAAPAPPTPAAPPALDGPCAVTVVHDAGDFDGLVSLADALGLDAAEIDHVAGAFIADVIRALLSAG